MTVLASAAPFLIARASRDGPRMGFNFLTSRGSSPAFRQQCRKSGLPAARPACPANPVVGVSAGILLPPVEGVRERRSAAVGQPPSHERKLLYSFIRPARYRDDPIARWHPGGGHRETAVMPSSAGDPG